MGLNCAQSLPPISEPLGNVRTVAAGVPGQSQPTEVIATHTDQVVLLLSDLPSSLPMTPNLYQAFRRTEFTFAGVAEECESVLKFRVCKYKQTIKIIVGGVVVSASASPLLADGDSEAAGLCWGEVIGVGLGAVPLQFSSRPSGEDPLGGAVAMAHALATHFDTHTGTAAQPVPKRISKQGFTEIVSMIALARRQKPPADDEIALPSLESGYGALRDIAADLESATSPLVPDLLVVFGNLASTDVHSTGGATTDETWLSEAGILAAERLVEA